MEEPTALDASYATRFAGWWMLDRVPLSLADEIAATLHAAGTSFASTSEPWDGSRRFYLSDASRDVMTQRGYFASAPEI